MKKSILSLSLIFFACITTPKPVYRLVPDTEKSAWLQGQEFIHLENKLYDLVFAYDKNWNNNFVFDFEIANKSDSTTLITPTDFYYKPIFSEQRIKEKPIFGTEKFIGKSTALDPELKILQMDLNQSRADAAYQTRSDQLMGLTALDLVFDIATIGDPKTDLEEAQEEIDDLGRELEIAKNENQYAGTIQNINHVKNQWREEALRKTSLKPGYSISGKIYFPIDFVDLKHAQYSKNLLFYFPIGDTIFTQAYKRRSIHPNRLRRKK